MIKLKLNNEFLGKELTEIIESSMEKVDRMEVYINNINRGNGIHFNSIKGEIRYKFWEPWLDIWRDNHALDGPPPGIPNFQFLVPLIPFIGQMLYAYIWIKEKKFIIETNIIDERPYRDLQFILYGYDRPDINEGEPWYPYIEKYFDEFKRIFYEELK